MLLVIRRSLLIFSVSLVAACSDVEKTVVDSGPPVPARPVVGTVKSTTGQATITRDGKTSTVKVGDVFLKDLITTGSDGKVVIRFKEGHEIELEPDGSYELTQGDAGLMVKIGDGEVFATVIPDGAGGDLTLSLETPYGLVRLGNSEVRVGIGDAQALVNVSMGSVQLVNKDGSLQVGTGDAMILSPEGAKPQKPKDVVEPLSVGLGLVQGRLDYRAKGSNRFAPVNAKKPPTIKEGDALKIGVGSATLLLGKSNAKVTLSRGTEVGLGAAQLLNSVETTELLVKTGQVSVILPVGTKRALKPGDGYTLATDNGGQFSVARTRTGLELNTVVGDIVVQRDGQEPITLHAGQSTTLSPKGPTPIRDQPRESVVMPSRWGTKIFHKRVDSLAIGWPGGDDKPYRVTVANNAALKEPTIDGIVRHPWLNVPLPSQGLLFWKVFDEKEKEIAKGSISTQPERGPNVLGQLINEVPAGREKTVIYYQDKPPAVTFTWKAPEFEVASYQLQVWRADNLSAPIETRAGIKELLIQLPPQLLTEGAYKWAVTPMNDKGTALQGGGMNNLEMIYDNVVSDLIITSPKQDDPMRATVNATGIAPLGTKVFVNGKELAVDAKGRFNEKITPLPGGRVVFRTAGENGDEYIIRTLKRGG